MKAACVVRVARTPIPTATSAVISFFQRIGRKSRKQRNGTTVTASATEDPIANVFVNASGLKSFPS